MEGRGERKGQRKEVRQEGRCDGHTKKEMGGWMVDDGWVDGRTDGRMGMMGR